MSRKRKAEDGEELQGEELHAQEVEMPQLSLTGALGISLNINQGWTPILSPDGAVIGARGDDGTKVHVKVAHPGTALLEFVQ